MQNLRKLDTTFYLVYVVKKLFVTLIIHGVNLKFLGNQYKLNGIINQWIQLFYVIYTLNTLQFNIISS